MGWTLDVPHESGYSILYSHLAPLRTFTWDDIQPYFVTSSALWFRVAIILKGLQIKAFDNTHVQTVKKMAVQ